MEQIKKEKLIRFIKFGIVGASGILVNMGLLWFTHDELNITLEIASMIAVVVAIFYNFNLNDIWTWGDSKKDRKHSYFHRIWRYYISASIGAGINYGLLLLLVKIFGMYYLLANLIGILAGTASNFQLGDRWVFKNHLPN